jgi:hypothetical protein
MKCYKVSVRFIFCRHKPVLVSVDLKKGWNVPAFLVRSGLPYGTCVRQYRYFRTREGAEDYAAHLHKVYKGRTTADPAISGGQGWLFPDGE